jgi:hypothetical protein
MKTLRSTAERWDRQDALACIYYGRRMSLAYQAEVADRLNTHSRAYEDYAQAWLGIQYIRQENLKKEFARIWQEGE